MSKVIVRKNTYTVEPLYQWDLDQELKIYGLSLASIPEIHFANAAMDRAIVRQASMDASGVISVQVPNSLLQKPYTIAAYVCAYEGATFETSYKIEVPVKPRQQPSDYTLTDGDREVYSFNALENQVVNCLAYAGQVMAEAQKALSTATAAISHVDTAKTAATQAATQAQSSQAAAQTAATQAQSSQAAAQTAATQAALSQTGAAAARDEAVAAKNTVEALQATISNENLLDNWLFTADSLIDQKRGYVVPPGIDYYTDTGMTTPAGVTQKYYTATVVSSTYASFIGDGGATLYVSVSDIVRGYVGAGYGPDRLKRLYAYTAVLIENDGIKVLLNTTLQSGAQRVGEEIENPSRFSGKTVTFSALAKEKTASKAQLLIKYRSTDTGNVDTFRTSVVSDDGFGTLTVNLPANLTLLAFEFDGADTRNGDQFGAYTKFAAVKAEEGPIQTLARKDENGNWQRIDPPPHPAEALAKCQRHFRRTGSFTREAPYIRAGQGIATSATVAQILLSNPVEFRAVPAVAYTGAWELYDGANSYPVTAMSNIGAGTDTTLLSVTSSGLTVGKMYQLRAANDGTASIYRDANL